MRWPVVKNPGRNINKGGNDLLTVSLAFFLTVKSF